MAMQFCVIMAMHMYMSTYIELCAWNLHAKNNASTLGYQLQHGMAFILRSPIAWLPAGP